jgi:hypothetical protein
MAATNQQMYELSQGVTFSKRVQAAIMKKAVAICDDVRLNGTTEVPIQGQTPNYSAAQKARAFSIGQGQSLQPYMLALACSTNIVASTLTVVNDETISDISDAALDSQVYTTVFQDLL